MGWQVGARLSDSGQDVFPGDRYMIGSPWKASQGRVNGYTIQFTRTKSHADRTALSHNIVSTSSSSVKNARQSLGVK